jgi:hypothetical protein
MPSSRSRCGGTASSEEAALPHGLARGHSWLFGVPVPVDHPYNASQLPSGYLIGSAEDKTHFLVAQLDGGRYGSATVLSPEGIAAMHAPVVSRGPGSGTDGLGWVNHPIGGVPAVQHDGVHPNFRTLVLLQPDTRRGAVLLMNSWGMIASVTAFKEIEEGVARLLAG